MCTSITPKLTLSDTSLLFHHITSITHNTNAQAVLQRESLKSDLDSKLTVIFQNYGMELEQVHYLAS